MNKMVLIGAGSVALLAAAGGGMYMFMKPEPQFDAAGELAPAVAAAMPMHYYNIHPEFVVNFRDRPKKFLMAEISVATQDDEVPAIIDDHVPEIRNDLLLMLAEQDDEALLTAEGKAALREKARELVDAVVAKYHAPGRVVDVYLTRFVMQ